MTMRWLLLPLASLLAGCAMVPEPDELGPRLRVRLTGDAKRATTADWFLFAEVWTPDGTRLPVRILAPENATADDLAFVIGKQLQTQCNLGPVDTAETEAGDPKRAQDVLLPPGYALCLDDDSYYAYRIVEGGRRMVASTRPEIRLGAITVDGDEYFEVEPTKGPRLDRATDPPGWPRRDPR